MYFKHNFSAKMIQKKILWRSNLKTQLEDWVFLCCLRDIKIAWINPCIVQMSWVDSFCTEKTCLNHVYDTSVWIFFSIKEQLHFCQTKQIQSNQKPET